MSAGGSIPQVGANKDIGPQGAYTPATPSLQHAAYRLITEIIEKCRILNTPGISNEARYSITRDIAIDFYSALSGKLAKSKDPEDVKDLQEAKDLVTSIFSYEVPYASFPDTELKSGNQNLPYYKISSGPDGMNVLAEHLGGTLDRLINVDTQRKYLEGFNKILPHYAGLRALAAKHGIWNDERVVQATVSSNSIERIQEAIRGKVEQMQGDAARASKEVKKP